MSTRGSVLKVDRVASVEILSVWHAIRVPYPEASGVVDILESEGINVLARVRIDWGHQVVRN